MTHCRSSIRWVAGIVLAASVVAAAIFYSYAKCQHEYVATISIVHFLSKSLQLYVEDHGMYPGDLAEMILSENLDTRLISPGDNTSVQYRRPAATDSDNTPILIYSYHGKPIFVTKDFTLEY